MPLFTLHTGSEIFRGSAEFRGFSRNYGHSWVQCRSGEKSKSQYRRGELSNYWTYRNGSPIKIFRILRGNVWKYFQKCRNMACTPYLSCFSVVQFALIVAIIARRTVFSSNRNYAFHCLCTLCPMYMSQCRYMGTSGKYLQCKEWHGRVSSPIISNDKS